LDEIYAALDADSRRLALMGARTVVDMVLTDKVGDAGSFAQRLTALERQGFIGKKNREILESALEAGHAATHRAYNPSPKVLLGVMDIVENVLQAVYVLEETAKELDKATPKRKTAKP